MGLRCSELCGLRWSDIDLDKKEMTISQALTREAGITYIDETKSLSSNRVLPIPDMLVALLLEEKNKATNEYVATANGLHITPDHFSEHQLKVFYNGIDVPLDMRLTAHELRHTCGTLLYEETKDIYYVSKFLGHSDIGITTKTYVHSQMHQKKVRIVP
jgi:integrase